jgi:hypothetical protein
VAKTRVAATLDEQMQRIHRDYLADGGPLPVTVHDLYCYAMGTGKWQPQPADMCKQFSKQMSRALRAEHFNDDKGRTIRRNHAVLIPGKDGQGRSIQTALWDDIDTAPRPFMEKAFAKRRRQIVGSCKQLKNDVGYVNDSADNEPLIQLLLDFTEDVAEGELPTEYNPDSTE